MVRTTPALVPTHRRSRQTNMAVTRRQAALCCLIMSSQPSGSNREHKAIEDIIPLSLSCLLFICNVVNVINVVSLD